MTQAFYQHRLTHRQTTRLVSPLAWLRHVGSRVRFDLRDGETTATVIVGERPILRMQREFDALRGRTGDLADWTTSLPRFLELAALDSELPVLLLLHRRQAPYAAIMLNIRHRFGIPLGLARVGNRDGQGGVVADPGDRVAVMESAARLLMRSPFVHTLVMSTEWRGDAAAGDSLPVTGLHGDWLLRDMAIRLDLSGGQEATMTRLGYKMRRNLRYYRRRAETDLGCRFIPDLAQEQRAAAVAALYDKGVYPNRAQRAWRLEAGLQSTPGSFAMGLQDAAGNWLSYLAGWRTPLGTFIDWQLNHDQISNASISTAMRSYLLDHEMARNTPAVTFVGGTAPFWRRVCEPRLCADMLATRRGLAGRIATRLTFMISPEGEVAQLHERKMALVD